MALPTSAPAPGRPAPRSGSRGAAGTAVRALREAAGWLVTPLVPRDYLDLIDPLRSASALRARVVAVRREGPAAATLVLRPGRGWAGHVPGQYVRLGVDVDGVRHWRAYSLTHRPGEGLISITVKAIPGGRVSAHLVHRTRAGDVLTLDQATGDFTLPVPAPDAVLLVTAGSGITPVLGMLRSGALAGSDVVHVHCAPSAADALFTDELRGHGGRDRHRFVLHTDDTAGVLDLAGSLDALVPDWRDRQTWVCGPTGLLDDAETLWAAAGLAGSLHTERFRATLVEPGDGGRVSFTRSAVTVDADGATTILDAGEDAGVPMPSGCRMGICFGCVVTLRAGAVRDLRTGEVTSADDQPVPVQTCISAAAGAACLDL